MSRFMALCATSIAVFAMTAAPAFAWDNGGGDHHGGGDKHGSSYHEGSGGNDKGSGGDRHCPPKPKPGDYTPAPTPPPVVKPPHDVGTPPVVPPAPAPSTTQQQQSQMVTNVIYVTNNVTTTVPPVPVSSGPKPKATHKRHCKPKHPRRHHRCNCHAVKPKPKPRAKVPRLCRTPHGGHIVCGKTPPKVGKG